MESQTKNITKYEKVLKVYMPDGAELMFDSRNYEWGDFSNGGNIFEYHIFSKDEKEIHTIKGHFAIREIVRKEEAKKE